MKIDCSQSIILLTFDCDHHFPHNTDDCLLTVSRLFSVGVKSTMKSQLYVDLTWKVILLSTFSQLIVNLESQLSIDYFWDIRQLLVKYKSIFCFLKVDSWLL